MNIAKIYGLDEKEKLTIVNNKVYKTNDITRIIIDNKLDIENLSLLFLPVYKVNNNSIAIVNIDEINMELMNDLNNNGYMTGFWLDYSESICIITCNTTEDLKKAKLLINIYRMNNLEISQFESLINNIKDKEVYSTKNKLLPLEKYNDLEEKNNLIERLSDIFKEVK